MINTIVVYVLPEIFWILTFYLLLRFRCSWRYSWNFPCLYLPTESSLEGAREKLTPITMLTETQDFWKYVVFCKYIWLYYIAFSKKNLSVFWNTINPMNSRNCVTTPKWISHSLFLILVARTIQWNGISWTHSVTQSLTLIEGNPTILALKVGSNQIWNSWDMENFWS